MRIIILYFLIFTFSCSQSPIQYDEKVELKKSKFFSPRQTFYYFTSLERGVKYAKQENKKVVLIFHGYAVGSCYQMEWELFRSFNRPNFIKNNYVLVWLAVDHKSVFDTPYMDSIYLKKEIKTIGDENFLYQIKLTQSNSQPSYCMTDTNLQPIKVFQGITKVKDTADWFFNLN